MQILAFVLLITGAVIVYGAGLINKRFMIEQKMKVPEHYEFASEEDKDKYRKQKALAAIKLFGLVFVIPGIVLIFIYFR